MAYVRDTRLSLAMKHHKGRDGRQPYLRHPWANEGAAAPLSSSSGKWSEAERGPRIHAGASRRARPSEPARVLHRPARPRRSSMDPRVSASLRSAPPWDDEGPALLERRRAARPEWRLRKFHRLCAEYQLAAVELSSSSRRE